MRQLVFSVSKVAGYIKSIFDAEEMLQNIHISGEVSGFSISGGNAYFVIKDNAAQLNCVCFAVDLQKHIPKNGEHYILKGSVGYYKKGGKLNFSVTDMRPEGLGDAHMQLLLLKERLEKEGVFSQSAKMTLPYYPKNIGVVTSSTGAVIHDIIKLIKRKAPQVNVILYPVKVQGAGAEKDIAEGIRQIDSYGVDVVIVARGGGSQEDLGAFNTETVTRAVFECRTPVVSAVGHETDYTLCDLAADVRASTPTAAADISVMDTNYLKEYLLSTMQKIEDKVSRVYNQSLNYVKNTAADITNNAENKLNIIISDTKNIIEKISYKIDVSMQHKQSSLDMIVTSIDNKSPLKTLLRGYSVVEGLDGSIKRSIDSLNIGENLKIKLKDGQAEAAVVSKQKY